MPVLRRLVVVAVFGMVMLVISSERTSAQEPQLSGDIPDSGVALVLWSGGTVGELLPVAKAEGCSVRSLWASKVGALVGYVVGAPDFANSGFLSLFPSAALPPSTPLILVCAEPAAVVFSDGFESGVDAWFFEADPDPQMPQWSLVVESGNTVLESRLVGGSQIPFAGLVSPGPADLWSKDVGVKFRFRLPEQNSGFGVSLRSSDFNITYNLPITRFEEEVLTRHAVPVGNPYRLDILDTEWHTLELLAVGGLLNAYVDGQLIVAYEDADRLEGTWVTMNGPGVQLDDVVVSIPERPHVLAPVGE